MLLSKKDTLILGFLTLCLFYSTHSSAQKAPESAILSLNTTSYDSLPSLLDSAEQKLAAPQARLQSLQQQTTAFQDSIRQRMTERIPTLDNLPALDSAHQRIAKHQAHLQSLRQRTTAIGDSVRQSVAQRLSIVDSLPAFTSIRQRVVSDSSASAGSTNSCRLPATPSQLPALPTIGGAKRLLPQLPTKQRLPGVADHSRPNEVKKRLNKGKVVTDSLATLKSQFSEDQRLKQLKDTWGQVKADSLHDLSTLRDTLVSTGLEKGEAWATEQAAKRLEGQLPEPLMAEHPQQDAVRSRLTEEALTFFEGNQEKLTQAKTQLTKLKKTYRQVKEQDSIFIKNTSLEGVPTRDRITYGLNANLNRTGLTSWQLRPQLGYQLNKVWTVGLGGQIQVGISTEPIQVNASWKGGYGFVQRTVAGQVLLYAELASEQPNSRAEQQDQSASDWRAWVGLGKQLAISDKLALQLLFLWDGLADRKMPVREQFQFRVGLCWSNASTNILLCSQSLILSSSLLVKNYESYTVKCNITFCNSDRRMGSVIRT